MQEDNDKRSDMDDIWPLALLRGGDDRANIEPVCKEVGAALRGLQGVEVIGTGDAPFVLGVKGLHRSGFRISAHTYDCSLCTCMNDQVHP